MARKPDANPSDASERLPEHIPNDALRKYFTLSDADLGQVAKCRSSLNKLGFAVQLCALRWKGFSLRDTRDISRIVLEMLAPQLGMLPITIDTYPSDEKTRWDHLERVRVHLGFVRCGEAERRTLLGYLTEEAHVTPRTELLRKAAHAWLLTQKIVRPGRTTLRDLIASAKEAGLESVFDSLAKDLQEEQRHRLDALLGTAEGAETAAFAWPRSSLEVFKQLPKKESADTILSLLSRLQNLLDLGFTAWPALSALHPSMRRQLALWGYKYDAWSLRRFPESKRHAILLCFLSLALAETADSVIEALDKVMNEVHAKARRRRQELLRASEDAKSRAVEVVENIGTLVLSEELPDSELRAAILKHYPKEAVALLVDGCRQLREGDDGSHYVFTARSWQSTRPCIARIAHAARGDAL